MALLEKLGFLSGGSNDQPTIASKEEIERRRKLAQMLMQQGGDTSPVQHWTQGAARVLQSITGGLEDYQATKADKDAQAEGRKISEGLFGALGGGSAPSAPAVPNVGSVATPPGNIPANGAHEAFLGTLKLGGLTNPNALAAVGATGYHESRWSPDKIAGSWSDPSESGQAGTSGGALSWRAERLDNLRKFAASQGEQGNGSLATQAKFFMQEDPSLVAKLNTAKSPEEAMQHMNNAWRFAGYNREGGEAAARMSSAGQWAGKIASADPNFRPQAQSPAGGMGKFETLPDGSQRQTLPDGSVQTKSAGGDWSAPQKPMQVAQAGTAPAMPQQGSASEPTLQQLLAARNNPAFDRAPAGTQALVNALIQKKVTQETKDPLTVAKTQAEITNLNLGAEKTRRELGRKQIDTQIVDGQLYERTEGGPWKLAVEAKGKAKFREYNGRIYQENEDGTLQDRTPEGAGAGYTPMTPDQRKAFNVPEGTPAFMAPDGKPQFGPASRAEQGTFSKKSDEAMAEYFKTHAEGGGNAVGVMQGMQVLREIGQMAPQGGITGRLANAFPGFNTAADVFNSQVKTLAPQLRIPGSGATSDKDLDTFMAALPSLKNTPEANQAVLGMVEAKAKLNLQRSEIARQALRGEIDKNEADKQIRVLDRQSVLTPEARKALGLPASVTSGVAPAAQPGATPALAPGQKRSSTGVTWSVE